MNPDSSTPQNKNNLQDLKTERIEILKDIFKNNNCRQPLSILEKIINSKVYLRFSSLITLQFINLALNHNNYINFQILEDIFIEIAILENLIKHKSRSIKNKTFQHPPLQGFQYKHFFNFNTSYLKNIGAHFDIYNKYSPNCINGNIQRLYDDFTTIANDKKLSSKEALNRACMKVAHEFSIGAIEKRAEKRKLTGERIIFKEYNNCNYYMTLSSHEDCDKDVYNAINSQIFTTEFNFLQNNQDQEVEGSNP